MGSLGSDTYLEKLLEGISRLRTQKALCDVTLEAEGVCFPAHKIILASASNYCKILFVGNARRTGSTDGSVHLNAVSAAGLSNVLSFIYSNKLDLSLQNVEETFKAAEALLVGEVIKLCFRFLESCLSSENCVDVLRIAKKLGPAELREKAMSCVRQRYKQLLADPHSLKDVDRGTLYEILDRTTAEGSSELELLRAAVSWLQHDRTRLKYTGDILKRIGFPLIPFHELQRYTQEIPLTRLDWGCRRLLQDALTHHPQLCTQQPRQTPHTALCSTSPALLIAGGRTTTNSICREMWAAEQSCGTWRKVGDLCVPLYNHCIVVIEDFLFVLGGQSTFDPTGKQPSNEVFRFDPCNASWLQLASMLQRRTRFHADVLSDHIFVVGGGTLLGTLTHTVESYQPAANKWEFAAPFPIPIADHAGTTHEGILYISGTERASVWGSAAHWGSTATHAENECTEVREMGTCPNWSIISAARTLCRLEFNKQKIKGGFSAGRTLPDTFSFLPRLRRWAHNRAMTFPRCDHGMAATKDGIFCIGGRTLKGVEQWIHVSETECYCPVSDQWTTLTLSPFSRCQFSVTAHRSTLYLTGGGLLQHMRKEDSVYLYDTEGKVWKRAGPLPRALVDHASCMVKLPQANAAGEPRRGTERRLTSRRQKATLSLLAAKRQGPSTASKGK